eukprot:5060773-Pyramimonas_sp.AAC.1
MALAPAAFPRCAPGQVCRLSCISGALCDRASSSVRLPSSRAPAARCSEPRLVWRGGEPSDSLV